MIDLLRPLTRLAVAAIVGVAALSHAQTAPLNDTGQTQCYNAAYVPVACSAAVGGDAGENPRQDARYGRDAQAAAGSLTKVGAGAAGFDFTKIANNGSTLAASAALGSNPTDWACTKDNVTGLEWEVKTTSGLRNMSHTYTWYSTNPNATTNGGNVGSLGTDTCDGTLAGRCNTQSYTEMVNFATLCGAGDWRVPTRRELLTLVHAGAMNPSIDATYFPNTNTAKRTWTSSTNAADPDGAWVVDFYHGYSYAYDGKDSNFVVRLVRGGY